MTAPTRAHEEVTPVQSRGGRLYKRDDLNRHESGVNGGKWRQCRWLVGRMAEGGAREIVSGASVLSPQLAMTAVAGAEVGVPVTLVIGSSVESASRHPSVRIALEHDASFVETRPAYNPRLQAVVREQAAATGAGILHYGVTVDPDASVDELREFHSLHDRQVDDLLDRPRLRSLILPFGSANTATSILYSLAGLDHDSWPERIILAGIGPNRLDWMWGRLRDLGLGRLSLDTLERRVHHFDLHGTGVVHYQQSVRYTSDGIPLHPTYEAKVARWVDSLPTRVIPGWHERDETAAFWIVGAPVA